MNSIFAASFFLPPLEKQVVPIQITDLSPSLSLARLSTRLLLMQQLGSWNSTEVSLLSRSLLSLSIKDERDDTFRGSIQYSLLELTLHQIVVLLHNSNWVELNDNKSSSLSPRYSFTHVVRFDMKWATELTGRWENDDSLALCCPNPQGFLLHCYKFSVHLYFTPIS